MVPAQLPFQGKASPLSNAGLANVASLLGVYAAEIWTVLAVETSCCGYLEDRRPQILFERHIFHRLTNGRFDDGDISDAAQGGYGPPGANQYDRLAKAIGMNRSAALQSASWGIGQVMGESFRHAGFEQIDGMVNAMSDSEDNQLMAMGAFLVATGLKVPLQSHNWTAFARGYNGANFAINRYDIRLNAEFQKFSAGVLPDLEVRAAQLYLTYLGFHPGGVDGIAGVRTLAALADFQRRTGLPSLPTINAECITRLEEAITG